MRRLWRRAKPPADKPLLSTQRGEVWVLLEPNPGEVFLLVFAAFIGATGVIRVATGDAPASGDGLPTWLNIGWLVLLTLGGFAGIVGVYLRDVLLGALVLRAACWPLGSGALAYAGALVYVGGLWRSIVIYLVFGGLIVRRGWQLGHLVERAMFMPRHPPPDEGVSS